MIRKALFAIVFAVLLFGAFPVLASSTAQDDLTETYSDEVITFNYPESWFKCGCKDTENALAIGNTEEAPSTNDLARDEIQVLVIKSMTIWIDETLDLEMEAETPEDVLIDYFRGEDVETYEFDNREAAAMFVENDEARLESLFLAVELGNGEIGMLIATTRPRDLDQFSDTVFAIGETLIATEVAEDERGGEEEEASGSERDQGLGGRRTDSRNERVDIELSEEYEMEDGDFALNFPEDWQAGENDGAIIIVNDGDALDIESLSDLRRNEVLVFVYPTVDLLSDFDFDADDSAPSTIVSFYASMAMATGFTQEDAMQEPEIGDGDLEASSVFSVLDGEYEQYVLAIENGDGDIITLFAYGGDLADFIPMLEAIAASYSVR